MVSKHQYEAHERRIAAGDQQVVNPMYFVAFCSSTQCYLQSKACRKRSDVARLTTLVNTQRTCTSWTSWSVMTRGVWCSLRFTMRRMDQWSKRTSSMCTLDCMSPRLCFRVDISKKILNAHWMHIECTLNAHWMHIDCVDCIHVLMPYWAPSKRLFSPCFAVVLSFAKARTLQNFWWNLSECRGQLRSGQLSDLCEGTVMVRWEGSLTRAKLALAAKSLSRASHTATLVGLTCCKEQDTWITWTYIWFEHTHTYIYIFVECSWYNFVIYLFILFRSTESVGHIESQFSTIRTRCRSPSMRKRVLWR